MSTSIRTDRSFDHIGGYKREESYRFVPPQIHDDSQSLSFSNDDKLRQVAEIPFRRRLFDVGSLERL